MRKIWIGFTLLFLFLLAVDVYPGLRGGSGWRWTYALPETWLPVLFLAIVLLVYLLTMRFFQYRDCPTWVTLLSVTVAGVLIALSVIGIRGDVRFLLFTRTVSPVQTGASTIAVNVMAEDGLQTTLERWPDVMRDAQAANIIHFTTSPPGQPLVHYTAAQLFAAVPAISEPLSMALRPYQCSNNEVMSYTHGEISSVLLGMLMPFWAALAVLPIVRSAKLLFDDEQVAMRLAIWWPLVPTVLLFAPTWNTVYPALVVTAFMFLLMGMVSASSRRSVFYLLLAGVVMSLTTFLNFAVLPLLLLFGLFTLGYWLFTKERAGGLLWPVKVGFWFGIGLISTWLVYWLVAGNTPLDIWRMTVEEHSALVKRDTLPWLILHPYDVLLFVGWPLAGLFVWGAALALRQSFHQRDQKLLSAGSVLAISTLMTFVLVNLSGIAQGENARIMSFYAPFFLLSAGGVLAAKSPRWDWPLLTTQAATVLVMAAVLAVVPLDLNPQPKTPYPDTTGTQQFDPKPIGATFTSSTYRGKFTLDGYWLIPDIAAQMLTIGLYWQGDEQVERPYHFEISARAENDIDGKINAEPFRWQAQGGYYLPTCWQPGDEVFDLIQIPLPTVSAPVVWSLEFRAYDVRTGDVMQITRAGGDDSAPFILADVNYP
jgi:hypothetical protein